MPAPDPRAPAAPMALARRGLSGLFHCGLLSALLGGALLVWGYHIQPNYLLIGLFFLAQNLGMLAGPFLATPLLARRSLAFTMALACALAAAGLLLLAAFMPPMPVAGLAAGLFLLGLAAGLLHTCGFHAMWPAYRLNPASTLNLAGTLYGLGSVLCALFLAGTFFVYTAPSMLILMAVLPALGAGLYARAQLSVEPAQPQHSWRDLLDDLRQPAAILFALLLFFQFGNEGAVAGWLALFLTQQLGASPATSLFLLALYWFSLLAGRVAAQRLLETVSHARLLAFAVLLPMFGCTVLMMTDNLFGATMGVLLAGSGFSVILPLVMERLGHRFPFFNPALFNGIFSIAMTGGLLAPASLGLFAHYLGVGVVMGLPLAGSIMVVILMVLIWVEARFAAPPAKP